MAGISVAALLQEVQQRQYIGSGSAVAAAVQRRWQRGDSGIAGAAVLPQLLERWWQAWQQRSIGGSGSAVRVRVRSYPIFNMSDILSR